jgi:hypothetical protein
MIKQDFQVGEMVEQKAANTFGVHIITAIKMCEVTNFRGENEGYDVKYQLDGKEDSWFHSSELKTYVDKQTAEKIFSWLKVNLDAFISIDALGDAHVDGYFYDVLRDQFGLSKALDE